MAKVFYATNRYPGDGTTTIFTVAFVGGYLDKAHVKAFVTDAAGVQTPLTITSGMWVTATSINIGTPVPVGSTLTLYRDTPKTGPLVDYTNGTRLTEANLDLANKQAVFIGAELSDLFDISGVEDAVAGIIDDVILLADTAEDAANNAALAASAAATSASSAGASASTAGTAASSASGSAAAAELSATNAASDYAATAALAAAIEVAGIGFSASAYDFGMVTDPSTYFDRDFGSIV